MNSNAAIRAAGKKRQAAGRALLILSVLLAAGCIATGWGTALYRTPTHVYAFVPGSFGVSVHDAPVPSSPAYPHGWSSRRAPQYFWPWDWSWFPPVRSEQLTTAYGPPPPTIVQESVTWIALWFLPFLVAFPAAVLLLSAAGARKRTMTSACPACGYSLAGLGHDAACPECGKAGTAGTTRL